MKNRYNPLVDAYIAQFPVSTQEKLMELRNLILTLLPKAQEVISYQMPAYKINRVLVYFAGYKKHIGFYPTGKGISAFEHKLQAFTYSKGAVQFSLNQPLPIQLITEMVQLREQQDAELKP